MNISRICRVVYISLMIGLGCGFAFAQDANDECNGIKARLADGRSPEVTLSEIEKSPKCWDNGFVHITGIYRTGFENSDLYDPTERSARAWVEFDPFLSALKCCSPKKLNALGHKNGGTFGFIALGIIKAKGGYGHMNGWDFEFQPICLKKVELLSNSWSLLQGQPEAIQNKILNWYSKELQKLY